MLVVVVGNVVLVLSSAKRRKMGGLLCMSQGEKRKKSVDLHTYIYRYVQMHVNEQKSRFACIFLNSFFFNKYIYY